jgi:DNA repair protein RadA/Sms
MSARVCASCGRPWGVVWPACEACGCPASVATVRPDAPPAAALPRAPRPVPLSSVRPSRVLFIETGDADVDQALGGGVATCGAYLLTGGPGAGKTTLVLRALSRHGGTLVSCEMAAPLVRLTCEKMGFPTEKIGVVVPETIDEALAFFEEARGLVVLDSLGRLPGRPDPVRALTALLELTGPRRGRSQLALIVIAQQTKDGSARGSLELQHDVDGVIELDKTEVRVPKHRLGGAETRARAWTTSPPERKRKS